MSDSQTGSDDSLRESLELEFEDWLKEQDAEGVTPDQRDAFIAGYHTGCGMAPPFPWKFALAPSAIARAFDEFFGDIDPESIKVDPAGRLDRLDDPEGYQQVQACNCVAVDVVFTGPGGTPVAGSLQLSVFMEADGLNFQIGGQPMAFKPPTGGTDAS